LEYPAMLPKWPNRISTTRIDALEWFVELDLVAKELGVKGYTWLSGATLEDDYKTHSTLSVRFASTFHIESARFVGQGTYQHQCLFPSSKLSSAFTADHGVVVSLCTRRMLRQMFRDVGSWWLALSPLEHVIVPVSASVLNIYRSGESELFPWDADIDANFIASHPIVVGSFVEEHQETLAQMGYRFESRGDRVVIMDLADTARMDIWLSGPQDIRGYDVRSRLCGIRVNFFRDQLAGSVWYYRPGEKIYGNTKGRLLHCRHTGHNACLPDCLRDGLGTGDDGCEFPDRFVHMDT